MKKLHVWLILIGIAIVLFGGGFIVGRFTTKSTVTKTVKTVGKTSLTLEEIDKLKNPYGANFISYDSKGNIIGSGNIVYAKDGEIFNEKIYSQSVASSGPEDGMIYTTFSAFDSKGKPCDILYIHNPEDLSWVAASITYTTGDNVLYTFYDASGKTIYDKVGNAISTDAE